MKNELAVMPFGALEAKGAFRLLRVEVAPGLSGAAGEGAVNPGSDDFCAKHTGTGPSKLSTIVIKKIRFIKIVWLFGSIRGQLIKLEAGALDFFIGG